MKFNIFKLTDQLIAYRSELTHQLQQCFDQQHPYNAPMLKAKLEHVDALIGSLKQDILELL